MDYVVVCGHVSVSVFKLLIKEYHLVSSQDSIDGALKSG